MLYAISFPQIDPNLVVIPLFGAEFPIRWYALAYIAALVFGMYYVRALMRRPALWPNNKAPMDPKLAEDLLTWMVIGVVVGGRLGFVLFYRPEHYLANPGEILKVWQGGMSFHGGFLGVLTGIFLFARRYNVNMLSLGDAVAAAAPLGICLGRLANFINGELWGRPTTASWGIIFPDPASQVCPEGWVEICARHPSQLYQAGLEGLLLFLIIAWAIWRAGWLKVPGRVIGLFFLGYGLARVVAEGFRQADAQFITTDNPWGHVIRFGSEWGLTMGQVLSLPMVALGIVALFAFRRRA